MESNCKHNRILSITKRIDHPCSAASKHSLALHVIKFV